jgi:PilZ domain
MFAYALLHPAFATPGSEWRIMASSLAHARAISSGRRRHSRLRLQLPARLITLEGTLHATLIDLSQTGAKVALDANAPSRGDGFLAWGSFEIFCSIAWADHRLCGLVFDLPLPSEVLIATRNLGDTTPPVDANRAAARAWAAGVIRL